MRSQQHGFGRRSGVAGTEDQRHLCGIHAHAERVHEKDVSVGFYLHRALHFGRKCAEKGAYRQEYERFRDVLRDWRPYAYTLCWEDGEKITDYYVEFEGTDALSRIATDENVMLTTDRVSVPLTDGRLPISRELFANDAVMTEGLPVPHGNHCQHEEPPPCDDGLHPTSTNFCGVEPVQGFRGAVRLP